MTRMNHARGAQADRMRRHGTEDAADAELRRHLLYGPIDKSFPKKSKAELRSELETILDDAIVTRTVACKCGHRATITVPARRLDRPFRCGRCGGFGRVVR